VGEEDLEDIPLSPVPLVYAAPVSQRMMDLFPSCILACPASYEVCIGEPTVIEGEGVQAGTVRLTPLRAFSFCVLEGLLCIRLCARWLFRCCSPGSSGGPAFFSCLLCAPWPCSLSFSGLYMALVLPRTLGDIYLQRYYAFNGREAAFMSPPNSRI
jgi:hypothetical protein